MVCSSILARGLAAYRRPVNKPGPHFSRHSALDALNLAVSSSTVTSFAARNPEDYSSKPPLPISRLTAGVRDRQDLNIPRSSLPVDQSKGKRSQQEPAGRVRTGGPTSRRGDDLP